jgi:FAD:protein FMN transferase
MRCSTDLFDVVTHALDARRRTRGRFDPTVLDALVSSGYDRTFLELPVDGPAPIPRSCGGHVELDSATRRIRLLNGTHLDLGGIAKGFAAEQACLLLGSTGPCLVNAGGDIAIGGVPEAGAWPIAVDVPGTPLTLGLSRGGVATSGRDVRRWRRGGREQHHLIDPTTGLPSQSDLVGVTVVAATTVEAEVQAKALFLAGESVAAQEARATGLPCILRTRDGRVVRAGGLA